MAYTELNAVEASSPSSRRLQRINTAMNEEVLMEESPIARMRRERLKRDRAKGEYAVSPTSVVFMGESTSQKSLRSLSPSSDPTLDDLQLPSLSPRQRNVEHPVSDSQLTLHTKTSDTSNDGNSSSEGPNSAWIQGEMTRLYQSLENKEGTNKDSTDGQRKVHTDSGATSESAWVEFDHGNWSSESESGATEEPMTRDGIDDIAQAMIHHDDSDCFVGVNSPSFDSTSVPKYESMDNFSGFLFGGKEPSSKMNHLSHAIEEDNETTYESEYDDSESIESIEFRSSTERTNLASKSPASKRGLCRNEINSKSSSQTIETKKEQTKLDRKTLESPYTSTVSDDDNPDNDEDDTDENDVEDIPAGIMVIAEIEEYFSSLLFG